MLADSTMVSSGRPVHLASEFLSLWIYIFLNGNSNDAGIKLGKKKRIYSNENPHLVQMVQSSFGAILPPSLWLSEKSILTKKTVICSFINYLFVIFSTYVWLFVWFLPVFGKRNYARVAENGSSMGEEQKEYHLMIIYDQQTLTRIHCNVQFLKKIIWRRKFSFKKICHFVDVKLAHSLCWRVKHVGCPINCPPGNEDVSRFYCFINHFILNILWTHHSLQNYPSDNDIVCV